MALNINGTTGISGVDGSASAASIAGTDANTGLSFASDTVNINTGGVTRATVDSSGNVTCSNDLSVDNNLKADSGFGSTAVMYGVRVWADFYWNSGTPTARNSGNVSSLTDNGAGDITVNFTNAMPDLFYSCLISGDDHGNTSYPGFNVGTTNRGKTTSSVRFNACDKNGNSTDIPAVCFAVIR